MVSWNNNFDNFEIILSHSYLIPLKLFVTWSMQKYCNSSLWISNGWLQILLDKVSNLFRAYVATITVGKNALNFLNIRVDLSVTCYQYCCWVAVNFTLNKAHANDWLLPTAASCVISVNSTLVEEVVEVYGFCICTLHLLVISAMIIGVMRPLYNERAMSDGTICSKLCLCEWPIFQDVFQVVKTLHSHRDCCYCMLPSWENAVKAGSSLKPLKLVRFKCP